MATGNAAGDQSTTEDVPLRFGDPSQFASLRSALTAAGFTEGDILAVLEIEALSDLGSATPEIADRNAGSPLLALLIKLFLLSRSLPRAAVEGIIAPDLLAALRALDLLRLGSFTLGEERGEWWYAPVLLYPVRGYLIASDRHDNPDGSPLIAPPDIVFPAIFAGTLRFLRLLPPRPEGDALDVCSGTGIAALALSESAVTAVAADITARATHFARFNRLLNARNNVEVVQGDLYEPVQDRMFDRIVAHPPYVPAVEDVLIYRDAGETGETIVRRCVEGLPRYLRHGGIFYALCAGWDTDGQSFETRARQWLDEAENEFDVLFAVGSEKSAREFVTEWAEQRGDSEREHIGRLSGLFDRMGLHRQVYGALVIHRRSAASLEDEGNGPVATARYRLSDLTDGASFAWVLRWRAWTARQRAAGTLSGAIRALTPELPSTVRVIVTHRVTDGRLTPGDFVVEAGWPFFATTRVDPWMAALLNQFDGTRPAQAVYDGEHAAGRLPISFGPDDFSDLIERFIERGYLGITDATALS